ncbi:serine hydrolase [Microlunatus sp. GCM10028923]|uniref:serine hydrolase n=1 Tax=Microlunatus sp. GCM10028923 TaxID=3273400 RepID=UPI0036143F78
MITQQAALIDEVQRDWRTAGLQGSLLARNLITGVEFGFDTGVVWPLASVIKLPIALVILDAFERGELDPAEPFEIAPQHATSGPTGVSLFRHPSRIAAEDLLQLSLAVSDNAATDLLLDRFGLAKANERLTELGCPELIIRHPMAAIYGTAAAVTRIGAGLAKAGQTRDGHLIEELDPNRANAGTARALVDLLDRVWSSSIATPAACARLRGALGRQLIMHRLAVELAADDVGLFTKTGTFLDLRHEVGVVQLGDDRIAVAALTRSDVAAFVQLEADFAIGHAARLAVDAVRS